MLHLDFQKKIEDFQNRLNYPVTPSRFDAAAIPFFTLYRSANMTASHHTVHLFYWTRSQFVMNLNLRQN